MWVIVVRYKGCWLGFILSSHYMFIEGGLVNYVRYLLLDDVNIGWGCFFCIWGVVCFGAEVIGVLVELTRSNWEVLWRLGWSVGWLR
jgi:hypothetical protein